MVAAMLLLAGCSGGGTDGTPTNNTTAADEMNMSQPSDPSELTNLSSGEGDAFANATRIDATLFNGTEQLRLLTENDTAAGTQLLRINTSTGGTTTLYSTGDYTALRNTTSGEVEYGGPGSNIGFGVGFLSVFILAGSAGYAGLVEWDAAGTTTVDGESAFVYESDSLNETAFDERQRLNDGFEQGDVQSTDGRMVIGPDGRIYSINVEIETADGTFGTDMSIGYDDITITKPGWVDESEAPN